MSEPREMDGLAGEFSGKREAIGALFAAAMLIGALPADRPNLLRVGLDLADAYLDLAANGDGPPATVTDPPYVDHDVAKGD